MKRLLIVLSVLLLSSCTISSQEVPLVIYDMEDDYMSDFEDRIVLKGSGVLELKTYDSQNSQVIQNEIIEQLLQDNPPLLIVNPVDRLSAYTLIEKANLTDTPIIFINREPLSSDLDKSDNVYYIGADPIESATLQAEIVMELFGNNPSDLNNMDKNDDNVIQAVVLKGQIGHQDAELRTEYVIKEIEQNGYQLEVLEIRVADFDQEEASKQMALLIEEYGDEIEVVIANNDAMAIGAIQSLDEEGYFVDENNDGEIDRMTETWIPVIGIDGLPESINMIDSGYLYGTVINDSDSMAEAIIELSTSLINGKSLEDLSFEVIDEKYILIPYQKYTNQ
jgi:methyl-galactoside transport system substrate-binding protein